LLKSRFVGVKGRVYTRVIVFALKPWYTAGCQTCTPPAQNGQQQQQQLFESPTKMMSRAI
jgi:biotin synthase-related radical SAM superfamily protein